MILTEQQHLVNALSPVADAFASTVYSDIINMSKFGHASFIIHKGVGTTGTSVITVEACDDVSASNVTAIPFRYREYSNANVPGTLTDATTAGFTTTAGSDRLVVVEVDAAELGDTGYKYCRLKAVESVNDPVLAGILAILSEPRYANTVFDEAIT